MDDETTRQLLNSVAELVEQLKAPRLLIPVDKQLWDRHVCAQYLGVAAYTFAYVIACKPDFPDAIVLPSHSNQVGKHPQRRWSAKEVMHWAETHRERRTRV